MTYQSPITAEEMRASYAKAAPAFLAKANVSISHIIAAFSRYSGLTIEELKGPLKTRKYAWPRQDLMARLQRETGRSMPAIGRALGGRDHTTILHGIRQSKKRAAQ